MALDTSDHAYEQLCQSSAQENVDKYYEGYLEKLGTKGMFSGSKWSQYWCVLRKQNLYFFSDVNTQIKEHYVGFFPLEIPTNIEPKGRTEWHMKTATRKVTLRTNVASVRDEWLNALRQSLNKEPPSNTSYILEGSGPVSPPASPTKRPSVPDITNTQSPSPISSQPRKESTGSVRYTMTAEQIARLTEHAKIIEESATLTDADVKIQDELLRDDSWYQALFRRDDVQAILAKEENGVFIVRDYIDSATSRNMGYVISLKDQVGEIRHHKIQKVRDRLIIKGYEERQFDTIHNLLRFFIMSQRKKVNLVPYKASGWPKARSQSVIDSGSPTPPTPMRQSASPNETRVPTTKPRSTSFQEFQCGSPYDSPLNKVRSQSLNEHGPPTPPAPTSRMSRGGTMQHRKLPPPPTPKGDSNDSTDGYLLMNGCSQDNNVNSYPRRPGTSPDTTRSGNHQDTSGSYIDMTSPKKRCPLPPIPSEPETPMSPPLSPGEPGSSYENVSPQGYRSCEDRQSPYVNTPALEEQAPALPPKRRSKSVNDGPSYVNLPQDSVSRSPRPPLRKAQTLGR